MKQWLDTNKLIVIILGTYGGFLIFNKQFDMLREIIVVFAALLRLKTGKKEE